MNLSHAYGAPPPAQAAERLLLQALDAGVTLFDTAALYGFGANETLVGRVLKPHRHRITLCSKGGMTGALQDVSALDAKDIRRGMPRFQPEAYAANLQLLAGYRAIAQSAGCSPAQLALAWLLAQGGNVVAIPGTTQSAHLAENLGAAAVKIDAASLAALDALFKPQAVTGNRYNAASQGEVDTEQFSRVRQLWT